MGIGNEAVRIAMRVASPVGFFIFGNRRRKMTHSLFNGPVSRRAFLKKSAATAALLGAANSLLPSGALAASGPEVNSAKLGNKRLGVQHETIWCWVLRATASTVHTF
jgi:hypothetical protein